MHPVLYSEIKQTARAYRIILFFIFVIILSRAALGDYGHIINLFVVFPLIAGSLGTGMLFEEYYKNYMKYLYTLPIRRWHFIIIKMCTAIIAAGIFLLIIYVVKWVIPPRLVIPPIFFPKVFNLSSLILFGMAVSFFNYAACTFMISYLRSSKIAGSLNFILLLAAFFYLLYQFLYTGYKYKLADYLTILIPTSILLAAGGLFLFTLRNPFLNRNPKHFLAGILIAAVSLFYFIGITYLITQQAEHVVFDIDQHDEKYVFNKGVESYYVSPDGNYVFIETSSDGIIRHSYLLDAAGNLFADMGKHTSTLAHQLDWQFNHGKRMLIFKKDKPLLSDISEKRFVQYFVLDIDAKKQYEFKFIETESRWDTPYYGLNCDGPVLYGICREDSSDQDSSLCLFFQDLPNRSIVMTVLPDSRDLASYYVKEVCPDYVIYENRSSGSEEGGLYFTVFDIEQQETDTIVLSEGVSSSGCVFRGNQCFYTERLSDDFGYSFRVAGRTPDGEETIYLSPDELPKISYKQASEEMSSNYDVSLSFSPTKKWLVCYYKDANGQYFYMLVDEAGNQIDVDSDASSSQRLLFNPNETRFCIVGSSGGDGSNKKTVFLLYEIADRNAHFVKRIELEGKVYNFQFLDDNSLLYMKEPISNDIFENNRYLERINIDSSTVETFFP